MLCSEAVPAEPWDRESARANATSPPSTRATPKKRKLGFSIEFIIGAGSAARCDLRHFRHDKLHARLHVADVHVGVVLLDEPHRQRTRALDHCPERFAAA